MKKNAEKNRFSLKWIIGILVIISIFLIGIYLFFNFSISPVDYSNYPTKDEPFMATVFSVIERSGYREDIDGVQLTITDIDTGISQTNTTQKPNGFASFEVIVGKNYNFVASFHDSKKSITCTIGPTSEGWIRGVYVLISENNIVDSIECEKVWFE